MGWFLSSKNAKGKKKSKRKASADPKWDPHRTLLGVKIAGFAGVVFAVALGWHFGTERLHAYIGKQHSQPVAAQDIIFSENPIHLSPDKINRLRTQLADIIGPNPLDRGALLEAANMLRERKDLVRELRQIRRNPDGTVSIDLSFRIPSAIVLMRNSAKEGAFSKDGYHVIDDMGFHMDGPRTKKELAHLKVPAIHGVKSKNRPAKAYGRFNLNGTDIAAGLDLIKLLRDKPAYDVIESISVDSTDASGRTRLVIKTLLPTSNADPMPCYIVWGLPPGQERGVEPDPDIKIKALHTLLTDGRYKLGQWNQVWINTGHIKVTQAVVSGRGG